MTDSNFAKLRELLLNEFSEAEVTGLCQDIGLNYESLPGTGLFGKTRGLLEVAQQNGRLRALQSRLRELRPDGYAALGIGSSATSGEMEAESDSAALPAVSRETLDAPQRKLPIQLLPVILVGLVGVLLIASFLWNRSIGSSAETTSTQVANVSAPATASANIPEIATVGVTTTAPSVLADSILAPGAPTANVAPVNSQPEVVVIATDAIDLATPLPTIAIIATSSTNTGTTKAPVVIEGTGINHPAAIAFKDLNAMLPGFYKGEIDNSKLQEDWRGKAYAALSAFATTTLPRALQLGSTPRTSMDISYEYAKEPAVIKSAGNQHTVLSREYWRYANQASGVIRCDTRDYTYTVVADNGQFVVTDFSSKVVETGCK